MNKELIEKVADFFRVARAEGILYSKGERLYTSDAEQVIELICEEIKKELEEINELSEDDIELKIDGYDWDKYWEEKLK